MRLLAALFGERIASLSARLLARLLSGLLGITLVFFTLQQVLPANPAAALAGPGASADAVAALRDDLGLEQPLPLQYLLYLTRLARGDLGHSTRSRQPVASELRAALPGSLKLVLAGGLGGLALGLLLALFATVRRTARLPLLGLGLAGAIPAYGLAALLLILSLALRPAHSGTAAAALALAIPVALVAGRAMTYELASVMRQSYIRAARAAGSTAFAAARQHAFRNALRLPLSSFALQTGVLLTSLLVVERLFALPGLGSYFLDGLEAGDLPACLGVCLLFALLYLLTDIAMAVARALADPRLRLE